MTTPIPRVEPRSGRQKRCAGPFHDSEGDRWQPVWRFDVDRQRVDGRRGVCRDCRRQRRLELAGGARRFRPWQRRRAELAGRELVS